MSLTSDHFQRESSGNVNRRRNLLVNGHRNLLSIAAWFASLIIVPCDYGSRCDSGSRKHSAPRRENH
jgi:hypothetical protein